MNNIIEPMPLSLYIHMPWCVQKCPYCDFNSHRLRSDLPEQQYVEQLTRDLEKDLPRVWGRTVQTIFIGGGTPSLFSPEAFEQLFRNIRKLIQVSPHAEITLEANPGTVEQQRFTGYRDVGINRLSIGIQSFCDQQLKKLGRIHDSAQAIRAMDAARAAGFDNFNLDLMFGLPDQTHQEALHDLQRAIDCDSTHLSWYQLTLEPNTLFHHNPPPLPEDDALAQMQTAGIALLSNAGFEQYEVSAYAKNKRYCEHNINYWRFGDYLGIGAGAHGKVTDFNKQQVLRTWKVKHPKAYLLCEDNFIGGEHIVDTDDLVFEFMLNALRLNRPIEFDLFCARTGLSKECLTDPLQLCEQQHLLTQTTSGFTLTDHGKLFLNNVASAFLPSRSTNPI